MSNQKWREEFISRMARTFGWNVYHCRRVLSLAATAHRLAEASCNGDYPADDGERKVQTCPRCEGGWVRASFRKGVCPDCRNTDLITAAIHEINADTQRPVMPKFGGDPRGAVVQLAPPGTDPDRSSDWIGVP